MSGPLLTQRLDLPTRADGDLYHLPSSPATCLIRTNDFASSPA